MYYIIRTLCLCIQALRKSHGEELHKELDWITADYIEKVQKLYRKYNRQYLP